MRTPFAHALDQAMAIEHGMNGAFGGKPHIACQPPEQELADLAGAPMRLFPFERDNQALDLLGQLVGITHWPPRAIAESLTTMLPVAVEDLVPGFTRYPNFAVILPMSGRTSPSTIAGIRCTGGVRAAFRASCAHRVSLCTWS
jgi:hypothetical protein